MNTEPLLQTKRPTSKPLLATGLCFASAVFFSLNMLVIKLGTRLEPQVSPFLLVSLRSATCVLFLSIMAQIQTKTTLVQSLVKPFQLFDAKVIIIGFGHIVYITMIVFVCVVKMPIVMVQIFLNLGPLMTTLLAVLVLGEKLSKFSLLQGFGSFIGVALIILGNSTSEGLQEEQSLADKVFYGLLLASAPLVIAIGNFQTQRISQAGIESFFLPWWSNLCSTVVFFSVCSVTEQHLPISGKFWVLATVVSGAINMTAWIFKVNAFKYDRVSRVTPIFYLESVFGLIIDYVALNTSFDLLQLSGLLLVFTMFAAKLIYVYNQ